MDYKPLCITAILSSPVMGDTSLPIDGIILSLACERAYGVLDSLSPKEVPQFDPAVSPIARYEWGGGNWIYLASHAIWRNKAVSRGFYTRRHNATEAEIVSEKAVWNTKSEQYRNVYTPYEQTHALAVQWYVVGNQSRIESLLETCNAIGKKRNMGHGQVLTWDVDDAPADFSMFDADGIATRPVPLSLIQAMGWVYSPKNRRTRVAYRPPYWANEFEECIIK